MSSRSAAVGQIEQGVDLATERLTPHLRRDPPLQDECFQAGGSSPGVESFVVFCNFCHNRNIGNSGRKSGRENGLWNSVGKW